MPNLLSPGTPFAGLYGPDAILSASGTPVVSTAVTIYQSDGSTTATLYTDQTKATTATNPVTTDGYGNLAFYADPGIYVLSFVVGGVATTKTVMVDPWYADAAWNSYAVTANATALSGDCVFASASAGAITVTLAAPLLGARALVAKTDSSANSVTVTTPTGVIQGPALGAGAASVALASQGSYYELVGDGTNYHLVAGGGASLPAPGASGDVLTATGTAAGDYDWAAPASELPVPGASGEVLTATGTGAGDYDWAAPTLAYGGGSIAVASYPASANSVVATLTLQPGTYLVTAGIIVFPQATPSSATGVLLNLQGGTATPTIEGQPEAENLFLPSAGAGRITLTIACIVTVTAAGTLELIIYAGAEAESNGGGYTYVQLT